MVGGPQRRAGHLQADRRGLGLPGGDADGGGALRGGLPGGPVRVTATATVAAAGPLVGDVGVHLDGRVAGAERGGQAGRGHEGAVPRHVDRAGGDQVDVAEDAVAGVPAAARLLVGRADRDHVLGDAVGVHQAGQVVAEAGIGVGVVAEQLAVQVHVRVAVHAVELDRDPLAGQGSGQREVLAVPGQAARQEPGGAARAGVVHRGELDAPVVRDVQLLPAGIVEARIHGVRVGAGRVGNPVRVDQRELPALAEVRDPVRGGPRGQPGPGGLGGPARQPPAPGLRRPRPARRPPRAEPGAATGRWRAAASSSVILLIGVHNVLVSPDPPGSWCCQRGASAHSGRRH